MLAIKQTLYRVGRNSPVVRALLEAQRNGKQVAVLVELKARFDEESNIGWARALEGEGVHVVYGLVGLKTHSKITLVVRRRRAACGATCTWRPATTTPSPRGIYTDLGLLHLRPSDGRGRHRPVQLPDRLLDAAALPQPAGGAGEHARAVEELIEREIEHAQAGRGGQLIFKMNALVDDRLIRALYQASQAGVQVDLIVRGICCLRPGVPGSARTSA